MYEKLNSKNYLSAEEATGWRQIDEIVEESRRGPTLPALVRTKAAIRRHIDSQNKAEWQRSWDSGRSGRALHAIRPKSHKKNLEMYERIHRAIATVLVRIRTGCIGLKGYLGTRSHANTRDCECGARVETVMHLVLNCRGQDRLREEVWAPKPITNVNRAL